MKICTINKIYSGGVMRKKSFVAIAIVMSLCFGMCHLAIAGESQGNEKKGTVLRPVPTAKVVVYQKTRQHSYPGTVRARARVEMGFNVAGQIIENNIAEGSHFKKGDVLARLDQREYQHAYDASLANSKRLAKEFERVKTLKAKKVVSQAEFDNAKSAGDVAQAELMIRKKALDDTVLHAPFDGVVAKRYVENFQNVQEKQNVLSYKDISLVEVLIQVPETIVATTTTESIKKIEVVFDADKKKSFKGEIKEFSLQSDPVTRTYEGVIEVTPPEGLNIFPGMTATVVVDIQPVSEITAKGEESGVGTLLLVPVEAVYSSSDNLSYCWVIPKNGGNPEKRQVKIGRLVSKGILILSGLKKGEHVAISGLSSLDKSMRVRPAKKNWEGLDG